MKRIAKIILFFLPVFWAGIAFASDIQFPALTGRVVDDAHILSSGAIAGLTQELADHQNKTANQIVVVTLPSLQGQTIEEFGVQLGRHWGIGQKGKDNGVLLIVAPKERKVRIEVGYWLEGALTDAKSSQIIYNVILPAFKAGHMEQGVISGTAAILTVLNGVPMSRGSVELAEPPVAQDQQTQNLIAAFVMVIIGGLCLYQVLASTAKMTNQEKEEMFASFILRIFLSMIFGALFHSKGSSGGFSGGGGSFGGGGCSGGW